MSFFKYDSGFTRPHKNLFDSSDVISKSVQIILNKLKNISKIVQTNQIYPFRSIFILNFVFQRKGKLVSAFCDDGIYAAKTHLKEKKKD